MVKPLQDFLLRNQWADNPETLYVAVLIIIVCSNLRMLRQGHIGNLGFSRKKRKQWIFQKLLQPVAWILVYWRIEDTTEMVFRRKKRRFGGRKQNKLSTKRKTTEGLYTKKIVLSISFVSNNKQPTNIYLF